MRKSYITFTKPELNWQTEMKVLQFAYFFMRKIDKGFAETFNFNRLANDVSGHLLKSPCWSAYPSSVEMLPSKPNKLNIMENKITTSKPKWKNVKHRDVTRTVVQTNTRSEIEEEMSIN